MHSSITGTASAQQPPSIRELEVLGALVRLRKTTSAAMSLGVSQPAISRALAQLEERLGRMLFLRDGGRLTPTPDALALEEQARPILAALDRLSAWPKGASSAGALRVAASPTLAHHVLPSVVARFREVAPEVTVQVEIGTGPTVLASVADRVADLGLMDTPSSHPAVTAEPFRLAEAHCVMPDGHPLAERSEIGVRDLVDVPIIALARRFSSRASIETAFADAGLQPRVVAEASTSAFAIGLVQEGVGVALLNPFPVCRVGMPGLVARRFTPAIPYRTSLLFPAAGGAATMARRFADRLKQVQPEDGLTTPIR
jgi:DNA-binding transcriptional LysR family regulator